MTRSLEHRYSCDRFESAIDERAQASEDWLAFRARNTDLFEDKPRVSAA
ncbi:MAG: hypothetical protein WBM57_07810 [Woeseiaceae bacterium]